MNDLNINKIDKKRVEMYYKYMLMNDDWMIGLY